MKLTVIGVDKALNDLVCCAYGVGIIKVDPFVSCALAPLTYAEATKLIGMKFEMIDWTMSKKDNCYLPQVFKPLCENQT